jgi:hypothetical protein
MSDEIIRKKKFENFLRVLKKEGYPNSNIEDLAKLVDYNLAYFLIDFVEFMGMNKTEEFIGQGLNKLIGPEKKVRIVLPEHFGVGSRLKIFILIEMTPPMVLDWMLSSEILL